MILQYPKVQIAGGVDYAQTVFLVSRAARLCYNLPMDDKDSIKNHEEYISKRMKVKHDSVLEHSAISVLFQVDRGITHEMVRHRLSSFTQTSTRYCDYYNEKFGRNITCIIPPHVKAVDPGNYRLEMNGIGELTKNGKPFLCESIDELIWLESLIRSESDYITLRSVKWTPEQARGVLPHQTMAVIMWTANIREWRHILNLRALGTTGRPHPQMEEVMIPLLYEFQKRYPVFFKDIPTCKENNFRTIVE